MTTTHRPITAADRFALVDAKSHEPIGSVAYRALTAAHYWESFPTSYPAEAVAAAERLIIANADDELTDEHILEVLEHLAVMR